MTGAYLSCFLVVFLGILLIQKLRQDGEAWSLCGVLCLLTIPLYWLSYRRNIEINTTQGRFLLPKKGMKESDI